MASRVSSVQKGHDFENRVAELYGLMGYLVEQNVGILGHQIDMMLTLVIPSGIKTKIAVECKFVKEDKNLTKNEFMENKLAMLDLKNKGIVQHLVIVTTNGFSKDIWDSAEADGIQLLTFNQLEHQILDANSHLTRLIYDFEKDELSKYYVKPIAKGDERSTDAIFLLDKFVLDWIANKDCNHLSVLGEYGTGKTSFCRKLAYDLASMYNKRPFDSRIPILINLKSYSNILNIQQVVTDHLINQCGFRNMNFPLFQKMNEDGLFLLIFDGFDELSQKVLFDDSYANFGMIAELAKPEKSKVLLTCRTEFFRSHEKEKEILVDIDNKKNFAIVYVRSFDNDQIDEFLQKRVPIVEANNGQKLGWRYYQQKINEIFDLRNLAERPVLLDLITRNLPKLIEKKEEINAAALYKITIEEELNRNIRKGKTIIQKEDRLKLMKLLAIYMYNNDKLSIYYADVPKLLNLESNFNLATKNDIEYHLNDFLTCSFLGRDTIGNYRFSHKSFIDFFVAWKFIEEINNNSPVSFGQRRITYEITQFMKEFNVLRGMTNNY